MSLRRRAYANRAANGRGAYDLGGRDDPTRGMVQGTERRSEAMLEPGAAIAGQAPHDAAADRSVDRVDPGREAPEAASLVPRVHLPRSFDGLADAGRDRPVPRPPAGDDQPAAAPSSRDEAARRTEEFIVDVRFGHSPFRQHAMDVYHERNGPAEVKARVLRRHDLLEPSQIDVSFFIESLGGPILFGRVIIAPVHGDLGTLRGELFHLLLQGMHPAVLRRVDERNGTVRLRLGQIRQHADERSRR